MVTCEVLLLGMTQEKPGERLPKSGMETGKGNMEGQVEVEIQTGLVFNIG